jgi:hypothetical protein
MTIGHSASAVRGQSARNADSGVVVGGISLLHDRVQIDRICADDSPNASSADCAQINQSRLLLGPCLRRAAGGCGGGHCQPGAAANGRYGILTGAGAQVPSVAMPAWWATAAASVRLAEPSLARMFDTWTLAVLTEMNSSAPMSRLL